MLISVKGIENYLNIINICYSCVKMLPLLQINKDLYHLQTESAQTVKYILSQQIQREVFFLSFVPGAKNIKNILIKLMLLYQVSLNKGIFNSL